MLFQKNSIEEKNLIAFWQILDITRKTDQNHTFLLDRVQLEGDDWGLAYNSKQQLDMRYNKETMKISAADLVMS